MRVRNTKTGQFEPDTALNDAISKYLQAHPRAVLAAVARRFNTSRQRVWAIKEMAKSRFNKV